MSVKKVAVLTSGGDAPGMNAAIRAVVRTAIQNNLEMYGIYDGYLGMYENRMERLYRKSVSEKLALGGTFLGTARLPEFENETVRANALLNIRRYDIDSLIVIGGDGTYKGALSLTKMGMNCIGIPATIDNDVSGTDTTIGFDTALTTIVGAIDKIRDNSSSHRRCSIVEVMGRNAGDLAVWAAISVGAEVLITKETGFDKKAVIDNINKAAQYKRHAIIVVAEHMLDVNALASEITNVTPFEARSTILGYIQRGGSPTPYDRVLASMFGVKAIESLIQGATHHAICFKNGGFKAVDFEKALVDKSNNFKTKYDAFVKLW